jgi:hypothetical protein
MYLDDGLGGASDFDLAEKDSFYIKNSLSEFGTEIKKNPLFE